MTQQIVDSISYQEENCFLRVSPFRDFIHAFPRLYKFVGLSTGNYKGYHCKWSINGDKLYLLELNGDIEFFDETLEATDYRDIDLDYIIDKHSFDGPPLFFKWFSGELEISRGKLISAWPPGLGGTFEETIKLQFKDGVIIT